jgi:hypothetical protein
MDMVNYTAIALHLPRFSEYSNIKAFENETRGN